MIMVNNAELETIDEMAQTLFDLYLDIAEDQQVNIFVTDETGDINSNLFITKKEILTHEIIILGNEICAGSLHMFSLDEDESNYITVEGIKSVLDGYGYLNKVTYYTLDDLF
ncbi:MAG: hypothetical protein K0S18_153 [Anaerocolumna sp.]|nr:hypothetical protein [Anaerocolumna sp.]